MAPRQVAPSGLACMQCFKSKCKCISRLDGDGCERCHRLKKECRPSDSLRETAKAQRKQNSAARIGDLEGKVESLVKLQCLLAQLPASSAALRSAVREDDTLAGYEQLLPQNDPDGHSSTADTVTGWEDGATIQSSRADLSSADLSSPPAGTTIDSLASTPLVPDLPSMHDSETCFAVFRDKMLPSFPFTYIPPDMTPEQLQRDRPFLLRAIIAVASPSKQQKLAYGRELKHVLVQRALFQNQSSIDLLQGLLAFTAWSYDQVLNPSGTLSRLMLLVMSLACDLHLDSPLPPDEHMMKPMVDDPRGQESNSSKHWFVAEEQRAVLACFVLSSIISIYFAQIDAMKWKPRMDESLRAIEANKECPADAAFAFQVRLQLLAQRVVQIREQREWDSTRIGSVLGPSLSANLYIRTLQAQLHQLGDSLPAELRQRGTLIMHMHYIELCMSEMARTSDLHKTRGPPLGSGGPNDNNDTSMSGGNALGFDCLNFSWQSVAAIKAWIDLFLSLSPAECAGLSFLHIAQLARCLMVLYQLSTFTYPGWDCHLVRSTVDLLLVLDGVAEKLELASSEAGERSPDDLFMHLSGMMRKFRINAAAKVGHEATTVEDNGWLNVREEAGAGDDEAAAIQNQTLLQQISDDAFLESVFGGFGGGWSM